MLVFAGGLVAKGGGGEEIGPLVLLFASLFFRFVGLVLVSRSLILHGNVLIFLVLLVLTFLPGQFFPLAFACSQCYRRCFFLKRILKALGTVRSCFFV